MKLDVPFVEGESRWKGKGWCGPLALASLLSYYGFKDSVSEIAKGVGTHKNGGTSPNGLVNYCLEKGMNVIYFARREFEKNNDKKYSKRLQEFLTKMDNEKVDRDFWRKNRNKKKFVFIKRDAMNEDIEKFLDEGKPVVLVHNVSVLSEKDEMWPHYIVVVGYDEDSFYIHNVYPKNQEFQKVDKKLLHDSRFSEGLGGNLIVPFKK